MDIPHVHHINGHTVILHPSNLKTVFVECSINAGFLQETKETAGLNHLLEHILTEAWPKCGKSCMEYWNLKGVPMNASTDMTFMTYHVDGLPADLPKFIEYIGTITDKPIFRMKSLAKEKKAVIDELSELQNDPTSEVLTTLYYHLYKGGLRYAEDYQLQIDNLKNFTMSDIEAIYNAEFTTRNMLFIVSGTFNKEVALDSFRRVLKKTPGGVYTQPSCFTYKSETIFLKRPKASATTLKIAFPSSMLVGDPLYIYVTPLESLLNTIFMDVLRVKHGLVYGVNLTCTTNTCGTTSLISLSVQPDNVVGCVRLLYETIHHYLKSKFSKPLVQSSINTELINYYEENPFAHYYMLQYLNQLGTASPTIVTRASRITRIRRMHSDDLKATMERLFDFSTSMIVYQGVRAFDFSWFQR